MSKNIALFIFWAFCLCSGCTPSTSIERDGETQATAVCGVMYAVSYTATYKDIVDLLDNTKRTCSDYESGMETSYRNQDGSLKHAVVIGNKESMIPGTPYDTCIINWELAPATIMQAFEDVCINRNF